jgi:hypothetical protein
MERDEVRRLALNVLEYRGPVVDQSRRLARWILGDVLGEYDDGQPILTETVKHCVSRCGTLTLDRGTLVRLIEEMAAADPGDRDTLLAAALTAARAVR